MKPHGNLGSNNGQWKGDQVSYGALHDYIREHLPKPHLCSTCGLKPPKDVANISCRYLRDLSDWKWLCRKCHMESDGRLAIFKNSSRSVKTGWHQKQEEAEKILSMRIQGMTFVDIAKSLNRSSSSSVSSLLRRYIKRNKIAI